MSYNKVGLFNNLSAIQTNFNLRDYAADNDLWSPGNEEFNISLEGMKVGEISSLA